MEMWSFYSRQSGQSNWTSSELTTSLTLKSSIQQRQPACTSCSSSIIYTGSVMSITCQMEESQKTFCLRELATSIRTQGRLHLYLKDLCKRDVKSLDLDILRREEVANNHPHWRWILRNGMKSMEGKHLPAIKEKHARQKTVILICRKLLQMQLLCVSPSLQRGLYSHTMDAVLPSAAATVSLDASAWPLETDRCLLLTNCIIL